VERGLIDHDAAQQRFAVVLERDNEALKPVSPLRTQMTLDPDLVDGWSTWIAPCVDVV
jgi:hypothetical protein